MYDDLGDAEGENLKSKTKTKAKDKSANLKIRHYNTLSEIDKIATPH